MKRAELPVLLAVTGLKTLLPLTALTKDLVEAMLACGVK